MPTGPITPPVFLRLYREADKPETIDDFVAIYDMQVLLGLTDPHDNPCDINSGCYFRSKLRCKFRTHANDPNRDITCSEALGDAQKPAIFVLRSEYERSISKTIPS